MYSKNVVTFKILLPLILVLLTSYTGNSFQIHVSDKIVLIINNQNDNISKIKTRRQFVEKKNDTINTNFLSSTVLFGKKSLQDDYIGQVNKTHNNHSFIRLIGSALLIFSLSLGMPNTNVNAVETTTIATTSVSTTSSTSPNSDAYSELSTKLVTNSASSVTYTKNINYSNHGLKQYWYIQNYGTDEERKIVNIALLDHIVGTVNTMYYDRTGGAQFSQTEYYSKFRKLIKSNDINNIKLLTTRDGTVEILKSYFININNLPDPFAKYLTKEDLYTELHSKNDGFLGLGAIVEIPGTNPFIEDTISNNLIDINNNNYNRNIKYDNPLKDDTISNNNNNNNKYIRNIQDEEIISNQGYITRKAHKITESLSFIRYINKNKDISNHHISSISSLPYLNSICVQDLPVITAVVPYSPAERAGLTVGDRIVAVQDDSFLSLNKQQIQYKLNNKYSSEINQYFGYSELTVAKPITIYTTSTLPSTKSTTNTNNNDNDEVYNTIEVFRPTRVRLSTVAASTNTIYTSSNQEEGSIEQAASTSNVMVKDEVLTSQTPSSVNTMDDKISTVSLDTDNEYNKESKQSTIVVNGGNDIVRWQLLNDKGSIFICNFDKQQNEQIELDDIQQMVTLNSEDQIDDASVLLNNENTKKSGGVGYIRLTRFSRTSTDGFIQAINELETLGADSYIIDLRNNYGGVVQSAMMLASSLLRDPHDVLCFTMNSRGGFTPHDVEEFVVDKQYPGYLLSNENNDVTIEQVKNENPSFFNNDGWTPPSAYASLREQVVKRGIHLSNRYKNSEDIDMTSLSPTDLIRLQQKQAQKPIVLLINEGTASSAEVFVSALHDNGRTVALVGTKSYGKGLIQHTFPLPDGGGLRLTVAEYLTPALQHVSHIGGAQFDPITHEWVGGGIQPDIYCDSKQGIPNNIGADFCVGIALDSLEEYSQKQNNNKDYNNNNNIGGTSSSSNLLAVD